MKMINLFKKKEPFIELKSEKFDEMLSTGKIILFTHDRRKCLGSITFNISAQSKRIIIGDIQCSKNNHGYGSIMMDHLIKYGYDNNIISLQGWISSVDLDHFDRLKHFYEKYDFEIIPNKQGIKAYDIGKNLALRKT